MIQAAYIKTIELENIRAFKKLTVDLGATGGQRMVSVIIGRNGTCKSTLLRCIAVGLCHEADAAALLAEFGGRLVAEDADIAFIKLKLADSSGKEIGAIQLEIENRKDRDILLNRKTSAPDVDFFVCGYGPNRGNTGSSIVREYRVLDSVATLFDYRQGLVDVELMMRRLSDYMGSSRYPRAKKGIKRVLGLEDQHSIDYSKGGGVSISGPGIGKDIPLEGWADGYRMTFNWLIDLYGWAMHADTVTESGGIRGILLIDEIDQNLHPSMQSNLLTELHEILPEVQIFATTHSPLTALGTDAENVISLHRKGSYINVSPVPSLAGYSADDALMEDALFGTDPYPIQTRRKLDRHRELSELFKGNTRGPKRMPGFPRSRDTRGTSMDEFRTLSEELSPEGLPSLRDDPVVRKLDEISSLLKKEKKS
jgi:hypothetical protein